MTNPTQETEAAAIQQRRARWAEQKRALRAAKKLNGNHANISRPSHSVVAITKTSDRSPNISAARLAIENYLSNLQPDATATTVQISQACGCSTKKASHILHSMAGDGFAVNVSTSATRGQWRKKNNTQLRQRENAINSQKKMCNGNQPNGSRAYWKAFEDQRRTPARLELLPATENEKGATTC